MRRTLVAAVMLTLSACNQSELAKCSRELGGAEANLANAKAAQSAAEQKVVALEEKLAATQQELTDAHKTAADEAAQLAAQAATQVVAESPAPRLAAGKRLVRAKKGGVLAPAEVKVARFVAAPAVAPSPAADSALVKIGLSLPTQQEERWVKDKLTMIAEAKKRGVDLRVQVSDSDAARQVAQCENLLSQGIKVLILAPHDASNAAVIVEKAAAARVPVISYDRLVTDSSVDYYYLSFDNVRVGELQGEYITKRVDKGNYLVLAGPPTDNNAKLFRQGAMRYIQPLVEKGDIRIVMDQPVKDWRPAEAQRLCEQALAASNNQIDAVLAPNDGTAGGCIQALVAKGLAGKVPVTGQDAELAAAVRINQGFQNMTVFKDTRLLGRKAIEMALDLAQGKAVETRGQTIFNNRKQIPAVLLAPYLVTKDNLDELLVKSGYLNKEALYRK